MARTNNVAVASDTHCGCEMGLCPPWGAQRSAGGVYHPSPFQRWLWRRWMEYWHEFLPSVFHNEPFDVVINGDGIDGRHHNATTLITGNVNEQRNILIDCLKAAFKGLPVQRKFLIAGTESHTGLNDEWCEPAVRELGFETYNKGKGIWPELWIEMGTKGRHKSLAHFAHHIGTAGVTAYETTAPHREMVEAMQDAARWHNRPPTVIVRSHRHIPVETRLMTANGYATTMVTAGWQGKTPYVYRMMSGRVRQPQFGGGAVRSGDMDTYTRSCVWALKRDKPQ